MSDSWGGGEKPPHHQMLSSSQASPLWSFKLVPFFATALPNNKKDGDGKRGETPLVWFSEKTGVAPGEIPKGAAGD